MNLINFLFLHFWSVVKYFHKKRKEKKGKKGGKKFANIDLPSILFVFKKKKKKNGGFFTFPRFSKKNCRMSREWTRIKLARFSWEML